ncbi:hypothetical protein HPB50_002539 [Hyalomma asiaticum]|uniref:Uncharacterized protein n=1 Tax=Hyalomma asiaticum TaxID=266040 RepID=A0ACB7SV19_HYAAI|nr:hypothetical protein HPB50_002539 [Hyalomma asiaticum]
MAALTSGCARSISEDGAYSSTSEAELDSDHELDLDAEVDPQKLLGAWLGELDAINQHKHTSSYLPRKVLHARNGLVPAEFVALFGSLTPSVGHVCRIMKSEIWRQVRLLYDWIRVLCCARDPPWVAERRTKIFKHVAMQNTEFLWQQALLWLPRKGEKHRVTPCRLVLLDEVVIPDDVAAILQKGPKFSIPPRIRMHELLAINRKLANNAGEDSEMCLLGGIDSIARTARKKDLLPRDRLQQVVSYFEEHDLRLLQADKEGGFVVMSSSAHGGKASQALSRNFVKVSRKACRVK